MRRFFLKVFVLLIFATIPLFPGLSPDQVDTTDKAGPFLQKTAGIMPIPGYSLSAFYIQMLRVNPDYNLVPSLAVRVRLTREYSFFVGGSAGLNHDDPWYATSYGLCIHRGMSKRYGEWIIQTAVMHGDHSEWKNRTVALTAGGLTRILSLQTGLLVSLNYENGTVRNTMGNFKAEHFYLSSSFTMMWKGWELSVRGSSRSFGTAFSRSIDL
ncbi:TPA: hypothetical protein DCG86_01495 [Candidatus Marinimicrobia bacterium]|nr:hypothetical protein [Candidatus Neomarinimicrobiota bacterium]